MDNDKIKSKENTKAIFRVGSRIVTTGVCVITAILLPGFGKVMAFLGSFSAFLICIILPVSLALSLLLSLSTRLLSSDSLVCSSPTGDLGCHRSDCHAQYDWS